MVVCTGFIEPLNLECWLVNVFAGTPVFFILLSIMVIMGLAARFGMTTFNGLIMLSLFMVVFSAMIEPIYLLYISVAGLIAFTAFKKLTGRA